MNRRIAPALALGAAVCTLAVLLARMGAGSHDNGRTVIQEGGSRLAARSGYIVASS